MFVPVIVRRRTEGSTEDTNDYLMRGDRSQRIGLGADKGQTGLVGAGLLQYGI